MCSQINLRGPWHVVVPTSHNQEDWYILRAVNVGDIVLKIRGIPHSTPNRSCSLRCRGDLHERQQQWVCIMWGTKQFGRTIWLHKPMILDATSIVILDPRGDNAWRQQSRCGWRYHVDRWYYGRSLEFIFGSCIPMNARVIFIIYHKPHGIQIIHRWPWGE